MVERHNDVDSLVSPSKFLRELPGLKKNKPAEELCLRAIREGNNDTQNVLVQTSDPSLGYLFYLLYPTKQQWVEKITTFDTQLRRTDPGVDELIETHSNMVRREEADPYQLLALACNTVVHLASRAKIVSEQSQKQLLEEKKEAALITYLTTAKGLYRDDIWWVENSGDRTQLVMSVLEDTNVAFRLWKTARQANPYIQLTKQTYAIPIDPVRLVQSHEKFVTGADPRYRNSAALCELLSLGKKEDNLRVSEVVSLPAVDVVAPLVVAEAFPQSGEVAPDPASTVVFEQPLETEETPVKKVLTNKARRAARKKARAPEIKHQQTEAERLRKFSQLPIEQMIEGAWQSRPRQYIDEETTPEEQIAMQTVLGLPVAEHEGLGISFITLGDLDEDGSLARDPASYQVYMLFPRRNEEGEEYTDYFKISRHGLAWDVIGEVAPTPQSLQFWDSMIHEKSWRGRVDETSLYANKLAELQVIEQGLSENPLAVDARRHHLGLVANVLSLVARFASEDDHALSEQPLSGVSFDAQAGVLTLYPFYDANLVARLCDPSSEIPAYLIRGNTPLSFTLDGGAVIDLARRGDKAAQTIVAQLGISVVSEEIVFQAVPTEQAPKPVLTNAERRRRTKAKRAQPRGETRVDLSDVTVGDRPAKQVGYERIAGQIHSLEAPSVDVPTRAETKQQFRRKKDKGAATGHTERTVTLADLAVQFGVALPEEEVYISAIKPKEASKKLRAFAPTKEHRTINPRKLVAELRRMPHDQLQLNPSSWGEPDVIVRPHPLEVPSEVSPLAITLQEALSYMESNPQTLEEKITRKEILSSAIRNVLALSREGREAQGVYASLTGPAPTAEFSSYRVSLIFPKDDAWTTLSATRQYLAEDPAVPHASVAQLLEVDQLVQDAQLEKWKETLPHVFNRHIDEIAALGRIISGVVPRGQTEIISDLVRLRTCLIASGVAYAYSLQREEPSLGKLFYGTKYGMAVFRSVRDDNEAAHFLQQGGASHLIVTANECLFSLKRQRLFGLQRAYLAGELSEDAKAGAAIINMM